MDPNAITRRFRNRPCRHGAGCPGPFGAIESASSTADRAARPFAVLSAPLTHAAQVVNRVVR